MSQAEHEEHKKTNEHKQQLKKTAIEFAIDSKEALKKKQKRNKEKAGN